MTPVHGSVEANGLRFATPEWGSGIAAAGYRVVAPFLRGYAPTALPTSDTSTRTLGEGAQKRVVVRHPGAGPRRRSGVKKHPLDEPRESAVPPGHHDAGRVRAHNEMVTVNRRVDAVLLVRI